MTQTDFDVAIVGYGPVGAFAALLLCEAGLRVRIIERSTQPVVLPRAVGFDGESARAFQRVGLEDILDDILQPTRDRDAYCFVNSKREALFGLEIARYGHNGWRDNAFFDQPELEARLRERVAAAAGIEASFGRAVEGLEQSDDLVRLTLEANADQPAESITAGFVLGCDGASSFVRRTLGIEWESLGYDQDWLVVDVTLNPGAELPETMMQICDPARLSTYVPVKDPNRRWEFQLLEGETREHMLEGSTIAGLLDEWLPRTDYEIRRAAVYQFHAATARQLRVGRVFLAGDSAHQTPPFLGQGLNSGFRDAVNLGWKIPLVARGACDAALLDSYTAERDLHARDLVDRAVGIGQLMETLAAREAGRPDPYSAAEMKPMPAGGPLVPPIRGGVLAHAQVGRVPAVGQLLRQPRVRTADGKTVRLDALLGRGFALVGRTARDIEMGAEAGALFERLGGCSLALEGLEVTEGEFDGLFEAHPAAVIRPDRYVFGVVDEAHDLDTLIRQLGSTLYLR